MKNLLILANISFAQLPIKLTYFTCKSVDVDKEAIITKYKENLSKIEITKKLEKL